MEALTAAATAALALYDMVKGVQRDARVDDLRLLAKRGGRSGEYTTAGGSAPRKPPETQSGPGYR
jgi:cyclic pyranopterin phosphate synthase